MIKYDFIQGHYRVGLPWNLCRPESMNHGLCVTRLHQLQKRLRRNQALLLEYDRPN